jgi:hypothetical protein
MILHKLHRRLWNGLITPRFLTFCLQIYFQYNFFIIPFFFPYFNLFVSIFIQSYVNIKLHVSTLDRYRGLLVHFVSIKTEHRRSGHELTTPLFSNFLLTNIFSIKFLYFFIISSLFPYFNLFVSIFIQCYPMQTIYFVRP